MRNEYKYPTILYGYLDSWLFCTIKKTIPYTSFVLSPPLSEGLPGVLGNKVTWSFTFREERNKEIKLGTREQKTGNTKIEKILLGNT